MLCGSQPHLTRRIKTEKFLECGHIRLSELALGDELDSGRLEAYQYGVVHLRDTLDYRPVDAPTRVFPAELYPLPGNCEGHQSTEVWGTHGCTRLEIRHSNEKKSANKKPPARLPQGYGPIIRFNNSAYDRDGTENR